MEIYYLAWGPNNQIPKGGAAYTDRERAERHADFCNKNREPIQKLFNLRWKVKTLDLKKGRKRVYGLGV